MPSPVDAVVVGSGPNGLVAANLLADAGWDVIVLESQSTPGGAVSSANYLGEEWTSDVCSAFYPLVAASPVFQDLDLGSYGLRWAHSPAVLANPLGGSEAAVLYRDVAQTAEALERLSAGDGQAWKDLQALWGRVGADLLSTILSPFPPMRAATRLARRVGLGGSLRLARLASLPVRRLAEEEFSGDGPGMLLAGCSAHADLTPEATMSSLFGWLLAMVGQDVGFPVVVGGAGQLTAALIRRLSARGGDVRCDHRVIEIEVVSGRAAAAVTHAGERFPARHAILADVSAPALYGGLVGWDHLPSQLQDDIARFRWDSATVKFDWALRAPVPWEAKEVGGAGTVHIAESLDSLTQNGADMAMGRVPARPFVLVGQLTTCDPTRSPQGTEALYAYTHVPRIVKGDAGDGSIQGVWDADDCEAIAYRVEQCIEEFAPGFRSLIDRRNVISPAGMGDHDENLAEGAINGGTSEVSQQLVLRPTPGLGRAETPIKGLYLASSSAHPGGGVHGACGANAARAALAARGPLHRLVAGPALSALARAVNKKDGPS